MIIMADVYAYAATDASHFIATALFIDTAIFRDIYDA